MLWVIKRLSEAFPVVLENNNSHVAFEGEGSNLGFAREAAGGRAGSEGVAELQTTCLEFLLEVPLLRGPL